MIIKPFHDPIDEQALPNAILNLKASYSADKHR